MAIRYTLLLSFILTPLLEAYSQPQIVEVKNFPPNVIEKLVGTEAPDFEGISLKGIKYKLSELKGKVVVINFMHQRCGACILEIADLFEISKTYGKDTFQVLSISYNSKEELAKLIVETDYGFKLRKKFHNSENINFPIIPNRQDIMDLYEINFYPTTIIIDKNGIIRNTLSYFMSEPGTGAISNISVLTTEIGKLLQYPK